MSDPQREAKDLAADVRRRLDVRTFVQDVAEPLTGRVDPRKVAKKFNDLEHAVDDLATAVEKVAEEKGAA